MKRAPRSLQHHVLYRKYNGQDSEISALLGKCGINTDWAPGPVRRALLAAKAAHFWRPWIAHLAAQNLLPPDWEEVLRLALFLCPTLVMNLRGGNPVSLAVGLQVALMCGSAPEAGADLVTDFLAGIRSGLRAME